LSCMMVIPGATIMTLRLFLEPRGEEQYAEQLKSLSETSRLFLKTQFSSPDFDDTKRQIARRLDKLLQQKTFERMFSSPRSKLDLFTEINAGKVIVINADKSLLQDYGTEIYARFFIALIAAAIQERISTVPESERKPCYVYMDEFGDYGKNADTHITNLFQQARKARVGLIVGHTKVGDVDAKTIDALANNTSMKFYGAIQDHGDASKLAKNVHCEATWLMRLPTFTFAGYIAGATDKALPMTFQPGALAALPHMSETEFKEMQARMRERYAIKEPPAPPKPEAPPKAEPPVILKAAEPPAPEPAEPPKPPKSERPRPKKRGRKPLGDIDTGAS